MKPIYYAVVVKGKPDFVAYLGTTRLNQIAPRAVFYSRRDALSFAKELRPHMNAKVVVERREWCSRCAAAGFRAESE